MKSLVYSLIAGLALVFAVSTAEAGGGSKPNSTIKVNNNTGTTIGVIVDPSQSIQDQVAAGTITEASFKKAGGQIVESGTAVFSVKSGSHNVVAAEITESGFNPDSVSAPLNVTTTKGHTTTVNATDNEGVVVLTKQ